MTQTMQAVVLYEYGPPDVLQIGTVEQPQPKPNEVLIKVHAAGVNRGDCKRRQGELGFLVSARYPAILGYDVAGDVIACGADVRSFKLGDAVYGMRSVPRGGTYAEYVSLAEAAVAPKPTRLSYQEAAAVPLAATTALQALRDEGKVGAGSRVMVNGASGGVGLFAVQIARALGARVTGVCSGQNVELVREMGAETVIDYRQQDPLQTGQQFDVMFDTIGTLTLDRCRAALQPKGVLIRIVPSFQTFLDSFTSSWRSGPKVKTFLVKANGQDLSVLKEMIDQGQVKPVVDRVYPFTEASLAHKQLESGSVRGKLVLTNPWLSEPI